MENLIVLAVGAVQVIGLMAGAEDARGASTGVVRRFVLEEIERHVGELPDERYEPFVGRPVLVADSVGPCEPTERVSAVSRCTY